MLPFEPDLSALVSVSSQRNSALERVSNLASVPDQTHWGIFGSLSSEEVFGILHNIGFVNINQAAIRELNKVGLPDSFGISPFQGWVIEGHVDSRLEGFIEDTNSVGGEKQDAFIIFKNSQKDCSRSVIAINSD